MSERLILFVDDSADDRDLALRALRRSGMIDEIVFARDGAEALEYLFGTPNRVEVNANLIPRVLLLDLKLPKIGGLEVLQRVRAHRRTRTLPVVILSSSDDEWDIAACYDLGANSYVRKPIDFAEFASTVERVGLYWLSVNQGVISMLGPRG